MHMCMAESLCCMPELSCIINQSYSNRKTKLFSANHPRRITAKVGGHEGKRLGRGRLGTQPVLGWGCLRGKSGLKWLWKRKPQGPCRKAGALSWGPWCHRSHWAHSSIHRNASCTRQLTELGLAGTLLPGEASTGAPALGLPLWLQGSWSCYLAGQGAAG